MGINPDLLKKMIFSDQPANWYVHAQGFYYSGLLLVQATEKLIPKNKIISTKEIFNKEYSYKVAIYLLSHAIELSLKTIICNYNLADKSSKLKKSSAYSHGVLDMIKDLQKIGLLAFDENDEKLFSFVEEYLKWFGRYYCPKINDINSIIKSAYTEPDKDGLIDFKYKPKYPETHNQLIKLFQALILPGAEEANLSMQYLLHCP